jgi:hypothetical protein
MMNGIDVNVIEMPLEITLIADRMLPESPLPDALLALRAPTFVSRGSTIRLDVRACKRFFDQAPARRKIRVAIGQRPKRMQMVRKDNIAIELKWMSLADFVEAFHQKHDGLSGSQQRATILGNQREEESAATNPCPSVAHLTLRILLGLARARPNLHCAGSTAECHLAWDFVRLILPAYVEGRSRAASNTRRKKYAGEPTAAKIKNQLDFPNNASTTTR